MSVLQRKAQVGRQEHQARAMTVPKSLRVGLAKVADEAFAMALAVIGATQDRQSVEDTLADVSDDMLSVMLDGPDGKVGGAVLTHELVSALVQQQTTGRVSSIGELERAMTATDAALCAPLLDQLFLRAHGLLETPEDREFLPRFKFGARAENTRLFALALEDPEYNILRLTIDIAGGVGQASMVLILPLPLSKPAPAQREPLDETAVADDTLETTVMNLKAELSAVLCRLHVPLVDVSALSVGQELTIATDVFDAVQLVSIEGEIVTTGAMGQVEGQRALMLNGAIGEKSADPRGVSDSEASPEAGSDYSNLNLPDLDLPTAKAPIDPSNLETLPDLPALGDMDATELPDVSEPAALDVSDLPDLPDLPDLDMGDLPDLPDLGDAENELPALDDLPKINVG